jgi:CheY-like chemotaxis protein
MAHAFSESIDAPLMDGNQVDFLLPGRHEALARSAASSCDFALWDELESLLHDLGPRAHPTGVDLVLTELTPLPARVRVDLAGVSTILVDLIQVAIALAPRGEVLLELKAGSGTCDPSLTDLTFQVRDTGGGMSTEQRQRLFDPLGHQPNLFRATQLIERLGSRLVAQIDQGQGNRFSFSLRVAASPEEQVVSSTDLPLSGRRVLLAEDALNNSRVLSNLLSSWGMQVTSVGDGELALNEIEAATAAGRPFNMVLVDTRMPRMSGFTLVEKLNQYRVGCGVVLMLMSPPYRRNDESYLRQMGVGGLINKPLRRHDLLAALTTAS